MAKAFARAFYHSPAWRAARAQALRRDGFTCLLCGGRAQEVHHIVELTPDNIGDASVSLALGNLMSLCRYCHQRVTDRQPLAVGTYSGLPQGYRWGADGQPIPPPGGIEK